MEAENEAEAAPEVEETVEALGGEEEEATSPPPEPPPAAPIGPIALPVKARIICTNRPDDEPITLGKALMPGGSPLRMDVPGAGTLLLMATLKSPDPTEQQAETEAPQAEAPQAEAPQADAPKAEAPQAEVTLSSVPSPRIPPAPVPSAAGDVKCLCRTGRRGSNEDQIRALATTLEQISSMQRLLLDLQQRAQSLSEQLTTSRQQPPPMPQPLMGFGGLPQPLMDFGGLPQPLMGFGGLPQTPPTQSPPFFSGRGPPGGKEVFSAPGLGIYVVQKDAAEGPPRDTQAPCIPYSPQPAIDMQPWSPPDTTPRDRRPPQQTCASQAAGAVCSSGGAMSCGGGGATTCCGCGGATTCCGGGGATTCCGGGGATTCCGGGGAISCCGGGVPVCCGGGGVPACRGGGGVPACCGRGPVHTCCARPVACCAGGGATTCCAGQAGGQAGGTYQQQAGAEQEVFYCQGDCTAPCDSASNCARRGR